MICPFLQTQWICPFRGVASSTSSEEVASGGMGCHSCWARLLRWRRSRRVGVSSRVPREPVRRARGNACVMGMTEFRGGLYVPPYMPKREGKEKEDGVQGSKTDQRDEYSSLYTVFCVLVLYQVPLALYVSKDYFAALREICPKVASWVSRVRVRVRVRKCCVKKCERPSLNVMMMPVSSLTALSIVRLSNHFDLYFV